MEKFNTLGKEKNILIFSHRSDIDGMGPVILSKIAFDKVTYYLCEKTDLADYIQKSIKTNEIYNADYIFVTDLAISEKELTLLSDERLSDKVYVFDHHQASLDIDTNRYPFVIANYENETGKCSGTSLFYEFLIKRKYLNPSMKIKEFVELVRRYDTWEWKKYNDNMARDLTLLFECIGQENFISSMTTSLMSNPEQSFDFSKEEKTLIDSKKQQITSKVKEYAAHIIIKKILDYNIGVVFIEYEYRNELADYLKQMNFDIDIAMLVAIDKGFTRSLRVIKPESDIRSIAEYINDNNYAISASVPVTEEQKNQINELLSSNYSAQQQRIKMVKILTRKGNNS